ncbi:hypothetical protein F2Q70_00006752 [Brassica cretica]|uniref:Uncharacterized protein n=3 Tax=Brassica TaxID=3705 RepID=A0A8S9IPR0_BRACR|nr:PREDICTED: uncharacterized protein LOC106317256 [Brassica oleracea var. oleracea]XP_013730131.1 uncharacterized protein BNACNNG64930D [Brassica napus]KAF2536129.1 hypothetical protein F2Q68_00023421 [Brassica cretica]KAF2571393.1 hypothetical protein F2Q70_00006752 [Brassica cretica]KAF3500798.1 hypothetical protein F2Q69_00045697 [Brassica cretica]CAF1791845.1 unnamed protein product [Brassica napus]CDY69711.1 BnaCnng64930D [Brassica napus]
MGNCLVMEKKVIKIVRNDGKVLEYREPTTVRHILTQFSGHSLFDNNSTCHLLPDAKLFCGRVYYLVPTTMKKKKTKKVTFADPEVEEDARVLREEVFDTCESNIDGGDNKNVSVMRMKIVVSKQELEKLLQGGSVHEMVYQTLEKQTLLSDDDNLECNTGWRPMLDGIPEI